MQKTTMPVRPIHHRRNGESRSLGHRLCFDIDIFTFLHHQAPEALRRPSQVVRLKRPFRPSCPKRKRGSLSRERLGL